MKSKKFEILNKIIDNTNNWGLKDKFVEDDVFVSFFDGELTKEEYNKLLYKLCI